RAGRSDDQPALPLTNRAKQIENASGEHILANLHLQPALRIQRRQVVEEYFISRDLRILEIYRFDFNKRKVTLPVFWRAHLPGDRVSGAQVKLTNLRRRDIDIVRSR